MSAKSKKSYTKAAKVAKAQKSPQRPKPTSRAKPELSGQVK
jgi:hypothetical protein